MKYFLSSILRAHMCARAQNGRFACLRFAYASQIVLECANIGRAKKMPEIA